MGGDGQPPSETCTGNNGGRRLPGSRVNPRPDPVCPGRGPSTSATASTTALALVSTSGSHTGAIVGGVVGGVLGALAIVGGGVFLYLRWRRQRAADTLPHAFEPQTDTRPTTLVSPSPPTYLAPGSETSQMKLYVRLRSSSLRRSNGPGCADISISPRILTTHRPSRHHSAQVLSALPVACRWREDRCTTNRHP